MLKKYMLVRALLFSSTIFSFVGERKSFVQIEPKKIVVARSVEQLQDIVKKASAAGHKLSLAGTRQSQGGQTVDARATMLVMTNLNKVISFDKKGKRITVQAGMTWKQLLPILNEAGFSVKTMQSYCDFSIGGSLGVNCHGQDIHNSCMCDSVESFKIILADGAIIEASEEKNNEIFKLALGGYGLLGIITEVTLRLTDNVLLQKKAEVIKTGDYPHFFETTIKHNKNVALHSARLTVAPNELLTKALVITYTTTGQKSPLDTFSVPEASKINQAVFGKVREHEWVRRFRLFVEKTFFEKDEQVSRNKALASTIESLKNTKEKTHDILQEYFVPCFYFSAFVEFLKNCVKDYDINLLNVTVRYVQPTENSFLTYAPCESFAFVLYVHVQDDERSYQDVAYWTQLLIAQVAQWGGAYYLPYHLFAPRQLLKNCLPAMGVICGAQKEV